MTDDVGQVQLHWSRQRTFAGFLFFLVAAIGIFWAASTPYLPVSGRRRVFAELANQTVAFGINWALAVFGVACLGLSSVSAIRWINRVAVGADEEGLVVRKLIRAHCVPWSHVAKVNIVNQNAAGWMRRWFWSVRFDLKPGTGVKNRTLKLDIVNLESDQARSFLAFVAERVPFDDGRPPRD